VNTRPHQFRYGEIEWELEAFKVNFDNFFYRINCIYRNKSIYAFVIMKNVEFLTYYVEMLGGSDHHVYSFLNDFKLTLRSTEDEGISRSEMKFKVHSNLCSLRCFLDHFIAIMEPELKVDLTLCKTWIYFELWIELKSI